MSRVPPQLQRFFPLIKRVHRHGARVTGAVGRHTGGPARGLPASASPTSRETAAREPSTATWHPLAPARTIERPMPVGQPAGLAYFAQRLRHDAPERGVLELTDGRLLGLHLATVTSGGILDEETSHYWGIKRWQEHPAFWQPWPGEPDVVDGTVAVLSARGTGANYYHFVIDALPRIAMLDEAGLLGPDGPDRWVVDASTRYHRGFLELLGIDRSRIVEPGKDFHLQARRLLVPGLPNHDTLVTPETTTWLRERFAPVDAASKPERIYVTRGNTPHTRRVVDEEALVAALEPLGFVTVDPGALTVQEQIDHFAAARVIVSPHGAALTNLSFTRPGVRLLELFAPGYINGGYWSIANNVPDSRYRYLVGDGDAGRAKPGAEPVMQDIVIRPDRVLAALDLLEQAD